MVQNNILYDVLHDSLIKHVHLRMMNQIPTSVDRERRIQLRTGMIVE